jgi:hypothetical protein
LRPAVPADLKRLPKLIADLDNPMFAVRNAASKELEALGDRIKEDLREALKGNRSLERGRRLEALLAECRFVHDPEALRCIRAIQVLERIGTQTARQVLQTLASGADAARETLEARNALERLGN